MTEAYLLGRPTIDTDLGSTAHLRDQRVLVTGAGGSIGSELCRQLHKLRPAQVVMLDRDESAIHQLQLSIHGRALLDQRSLVICDIRDRDGLDAVFREHRPTVVFHAAALKHLPLLEMWPGEAVKTNVWGTWNVLDAVRRHGVGQFVNVSTDKAVAPSSVLGYSKRITERLTATFAELYPGQYLSVRLCNVLDSRGSVVPTFRAQIDAGGPVTITDKNVSRCFMTAAEAVGLVISSGTIGTTGQALVPDVGQPLKVSDLAARMILASGKSIEIVYTGLRQGEKLSELSLGPDEVEARSMHPGVHHVQVPPYASLTHAVDFDCSSSDAELIAAMSIRSSERAETKVASSW